MIGKARLLEASPNARLVVDAQLLGRKSAYQLEVVLALAARLIDLGVEDLGDMAQPQFLQVDQGRLPGNHRIPPVC